MKRALHLSSTFLHDLIIIFLNKYFVHENLFFYLSFLLRFNLDFGGSNQCNWDPGMFLQPGTVATYPHKFGPD